jgi:hypothetical protein
LRGRAVKERWRLALSILGAGVVACTLEGAITTGVDAVGHLRISTIPVFCETL